MKPVAADPCTAAYLMPGMVLMLDRLSGSAGQLVHEALAA